MTNITITTEDFGTGALFPKRTVEVNGKSFSTPTKAIPIKDTQPNEVVSDLCRGVNELYASVDGEKIDSARKRTNNRFVRNLKTAYNKTRGEEVTFAFVSYKETTTLPVVHAEFLVDTLVRFSDALCVPMFPKLVGSVDNSAGPTDAHFQSFKKSVLRFLEQASQRYPEMPVIGMLPHLGWAFIDDMMDIYEAHNVKIYCLDFNRRKITADTQIKMISPLMESVANLGIEEQVVFYTMNLDKGTHDYALDARPAADIASIGLGFDIIGGRHIAPPGTKEMFESMGGENTFQLFDKDQFVYRDIPLEDLGNELPADASIPAEHIQKRIGASSDAAKYRLQRLINSEQMALGINMVREKIGTREAFNFVASKPGITSETVSAYENVRSSFDDARFQSGLSEF